MSQPQSIGDAIETRRRSRSKTPLINLRVSADRENGSESSLGGGRKVRKTPTVGMIVESEEQQQQLQQQLQQQQQQQTRSTPVRKMRVVTSDYSSEDVSPDRVRKAAAAVVANAANMQLAAQADGQLSHSFTITTSTTSSTTTATNVEVGGKQQVQQVTGIVRKASQSTADAGKDSLTGKLNTSASPKKKDSTARQQEETVASASSTKRTTTTSSTTTTAGKMLGLSGSVLLTSTPKSASSVASSAKVVLTPEELQRHAAYKEYLEAGEYWNKFPKTDYTYSELSPHRREVAPGLVAMPNMSRPSLNKHAERVQTMIQQDPTREAYIRERYTSVRTSGAFMGRSDPYDSTEEVDSYLASAGYRKQQRTTTTTTVEQRSSIVSRFFLSIVTFFFTCYDSVRSVFRRRDEREQHYYTRIEDERGFFARAYATVSSLIINVFKRIYLLISSVLFLDAWLLQSTAAGNGVQQQQQLEAGKRKRWFLLFLLVLLPFLLIGAYLLADEEETIVFPASSRATLALSSLSRLLPSNVRDVEANVESFHRYLRSAKESAHTSLDSSLTFAWSMVPSFGWLATLLSWPSTWWSWPWGKGGESAPHESLRSTLKRTLSPEEYDELMRHIDAYVDGVLEQKYAARVGAVEREQLRLQTAQQEAKGALEPALTVHVAQVIEESLKAYHYHLTDADVERVAEKVRLSLQTNYPQLFAQAQQQPKKDEATAAATAPPVLTKEYLAEVQRLVEQQITVHNNNNNNNNQFVIAGPQLEELLTRILSSERLLAVIDERTAASGVRLVAEFESKTSTAEQQKRDALVDDLRKELNDIKAHFSEQLLRNSVQWEERLQSVRADHGQLEDQLRAYRLEHNELYQKLLVDIDRRLDALRQERYDGVNRVVRENIITILGLNVKQDIADGDLRAWINGVFVARDHLEQRLEELQAKVGVDLRAEIERTAGRLMEQIGEKIREEMLLRLEEVRVQASQTVTTDGQKPSSVDAGGTDGSTVDGPNAPLTEEHVRRIVRDALTVYDADKTGLVDYALESAGGQVLSTRCTESYQASSAEFRIFGIPIWYPSNTPRTVISPTMEPGQCWAFQGFPGYLVIQLNTEIIVTGFTLEHISKLLVANGSISSAPKHFTVWGLTTLNDPEPILLGNYEYLDQLGSSIQYFPVQNKDWRLPLQIVELRIETNHGNIHYTCLYRFRVHGDKV